MCGRYALYDISHLDLKIPSNMIGQNYNIAPSSAVPVVVDTGEVKLVKWEFKVPWAKKLRIINARSETLESKKIFQGVKRCVFIANGYFEWLINSKEKIPYYHTFGKRMMYFGGIYNDQGACIVTRKSYPMKVNIHDRQPIILRYEDFFNWLSSSHDYNCDYYHDMYIYQVSKAVNSPKNNFPDNILELC